MQKAGVLNHIYPKFFKDFEQRWSKNRKFVEYTGNFFLKLFSSFVAE